MSEENSQFDNKSKGEKTRENIIKTAGVLFSEKGYYTTGIDDIAKNLHIANGTLYRYFKSKEELLITIIYRSEEKIIEQIDTIYHSETTLFDLLYDIPSILYSFVVDNFDIFDLFYSVSQNEAFPFLIDNYSLHGKIISKIESILSNQTDELRENVDINSLAVMIFFIFESARHNIRMQSKKVIDFRKQIEKPVSLIYYGCSAPNPDQKKSTTTC